MLLVYPWSRQLISDKKTPTYERNIVLVLKLLSTYNIKYIKYLAYFLM